jgi:hypothetical protein
VLTRGRVVAGMAIAAAIAVACGNSGDPAKPVNSITTLIDAGVIVDASDDASDASDAGVREELTTGRHLVAHPAFLEGITTDGYVVFSDTETVETAKVISIDGGDEITIAKTTTGGKSDLRYVIDGKIVFVWSDRGDRMANLTMWSAATGPVALGSDVRPGRAAASADGTYILYVRDVTDASANIVTTTIDGGSKNTVGVLNAADQDCWRDVDLARANDRLVARYCPAGATTPIIRSADPTTGTTVDFGGGATSATYGSRVVWTSADSRVLSTIPDGGGTVALATEVIEYQIARDESRIAIHDDAGTLVSGQLDGGNMQVFAKDLVGLGGISPHGDEILYANKLGFGQSNVLGARTDDGGITTYLGDATSCAGCLYDNFSRDGSKILVINPYTFVGGKGPVAIIDRATAKVIATANGSYFQAASYGDAGPETEHFVFLTHTQDDSLTNGEYYGVVSRGLGTKDDSTTIALGTENVVIEVARQAAIFSFAGTGDRAGIWVSPLP